jgi:hypothetical protein
MGSCEATANSLTDQSGVQLDGWLTYSHLFHNEERAPDGVDSYPIYTLAVSLGGDVLCAC